VDVERLSAYLPMDRRHAIAGGCSPPDRAEGSVLFADIAGFTPLTESLAIALGPWRGAEELAHLLNRVYDGLVSEVHRFGGSVIGFGGDAVICWFEKDGGERAVACGLAMQTSVLPFAAIKTPAGRVISISIKIAVVAGPVRRFLVGDPEIQHIDVLAGATVDRMAQAEKKALQGELIVGPEVVRRLGDHLTVALWRDGFAVVSALQREVRAEGWSALDLERLDLAQLRPYLLPPVYQRLMAGQGEFLAQLRPVAAVFGRFAGIEFDRDDAAGAKLDAYIRWVQDVLRHYDSYLLQLTCGDKGNYLYAALGAPEAHEDDAERAVAAALALQKLPPHLDFITAVQIGVSRGRVRTGAYGSAKRRTYGALGDEVNLACRLMEAAPPGEIRCSQRIYRAIGKRWVLEPLPPVMVKGKQNPLPVYRPLGPVQGEKGHADRLLVGRRAEMELLTRLLTEVQSGERRVLFLEGEAGIGKSRLVDELARLAAQHGVVWLQGAAQSIEQQTPYRAWRDILASYFGLDEQMDLAERQRRVRSQVASVGPALDERTPLLNDILRLDLAETGLTRSLESELRHKSLVTLVVDLLRAATASGGAMALVLEDAHWLDSLSWELALAVARGLADQPLLLLLALRPLEGPLWAEYVAMTELEGAERLSMGAISPAETAALAAARLGLSPSALPSKVSNLVHERSGGNPFYAEELTLALRDSGAIDVADGLCTLRGDLAPLDETVPDTVEGVVLSRIDRLPPEQQLTLKVAAVIGRSFLYRTLRDVHPQQVRGDVLLAHLEKLSELDLTPLETIEPELAYRFKHVITQQVTYDTLLFSQRRELHRAVAGWYEEVYAQDLSSYYPLLVHHWRRAEDVERERFYARLAGEQAAGQFASLEALTYLNRALELTPEDDAAERYALLLTRQKVHDLQGNREAQARDVASLMELAELLDDDRLRAEAALCKVSLSVVTGDYPAAIAAAQVAAEWAAKADDISDETEANLGWGRALWRQGEYDAARSRLKKALALAQEAGLDQAEARSLLNLGNVCLYQGNYLEARDYYAQALPIFRRSGDRRDESAALNNLGYVSANLDDNVAARDYLEQSLHIYRQIGDRRRESHLLNNLGVVSENLGDFAEARARYEQALRIFREVGDRHGEGMALFNAGTVSSRLGDYTEAEALFQQSLPIRREIGDRQGTGWVLFSLCLLAHHRGDDETARQYGEQALAVAQEIGDRSVQGYALTSLGHALTGLGRLNEAAAAYRQAVAMRKELGENNRAIESIAGLARASLAQGHLDQAQAYVEEILDHLAVGSNSAPGGGPGSGHSLDGTEEPLRIYLTCYQVLRANDDHRAADVLTAAHDLLQERAARIPDDVARQSFIENVAAHREIVRAYRLMTGAAG